MRIILHVDLDSFYASVEEVRNPKLKGKSIVVCVFSGRSEDSGAVATANYPAREFGIKSGMPISQAKKLGGDLCFYLAIDKEYYTEISERVMDILREHADKFEQRSIDEAYLDVSSLGNFEKAKEVAEKIKKEILESEKITCSIGISENKILAKTATGFQKPDGLTVLKKEEIKEKLHPLPLKKLHGIGPKTAEALERLRIRTIGDLAAFDEKKIKEALGETRGKDIWEKANGIDESHIEEQERQQISRLGTLKENTRDIVVVYGKLEELIEELKGKIEKKFKTISIIAITKSLKTYTKSVTLYDLTDSIEIIKTESRKLLEEFLKENQEELRRCGVRVSNFQEEENKQKKLFDF